MNEYSNIILKITPSTNPVLMAFMSFILPKMEGGLEDVKLWHNWISLNSWFLKCPKLCCALDDSGDEISDTEDDNIYEMEAYLGPSNTTWWSDFGTKKSKIIK